MHLDPFFLRKKLVGAVVPAGSLQSMIAIAETPDDLLKHAALEVLREIGNAFLIFF